MVELKPVIIVALTVPVFTWLFFKLDFIRRILGKKQLKTADLGVLKRVPSATIPFDQLSLIWTAGSSVDEKDLMVEQVERMVSEVEGSFPEEGKEELEVRGDRESVLPMLKHESLRKLWNEIVTPYYDEYRLQNALPLLIEGFALLDRHFNVSSFSGVEEDPETVQIVEYKDIIARISLGEHTINVVNFIVEDVKKTYYSPESHIPRFVLAALFHDIGKVREYQEKYTGARSHAHASAGIFLSISRKVYEDSPPGWIDEVAQAIREHHIPTRYDLALALKRADMKARTLEVALYLGNVEIRDVEDWFDVNLFKEELYNHLNVDQIQPIVGFTFRDRVFVQKSGLLYLVDIQRKRKNVLSHEFLYQEGQEAIKNKVTKILSANGLTVTDRGWKKVILVLRGGRTREAYLLVLKGSIFTQEEMRELETRRLGSSFSNIVQVQ